MNEDVTMKDLLVAINELAADTKDTKQKVENIETRLGNVETQVENTNARLGNVESQVENIETRLDGVESEMKAMRIELKEDIRRVDTKFELVLKDLYETKFDVSMLQKGRY